MHSYWEQQRFDVLLYYIGGKMRDPEHNGSVIRQLQDLGYLGSLNTPGFAETMRTTPNGLVYLKCMGFDVDAPDIVDGRLLMSGPLGNPDGYAPDRPSRTARLWSLRNQFFAFAMAAST